MLENLFKKDLAGITFSSKGVVIVQQKAGKIKNYLSQPYPSEIVGTSTLLSEDIFEIFKDRDIELLAFLQKFLRDSKLDTKDVVVALPPKDLIIRFFEMPNIPRSEVVAGINFEMKKYIPFKIEELAFDFQYRIRQKANIIEVILCGMRQAPLERYVNLLNQLNLNPVVFEPALLSLFRLLVAKNKISSQKSYLILEFDKEEANILITEKNFPYFTRDIKIVSAFGPNNTQEDFDTALFRIINEVRVSLDYYKRQFMKKDVDEMSIISNKGSSGLLDSFSKELGLKVNFIDFESLGKTKDVNDLMLSDFCKCFGAALRMEKPSLVTLNLAKGKEKAFKVSLALSGVSGQNLEQLFLNFLRESKVALMKGAFIGVLVIVVGYGMGFSKLFPLQRNLAAASVQQLPSLPNVDLSSLESVQASETALLEKQRTFKEKIDDYQPLYKKLEVLPRLLAPGVWLNNLSYDREVGQLLLTCFCYNEDQSLRSENTNRFVENLKGSADFTNTFSYIELKSYREINGSGETYLQFDVACTKNKQE